MVTVGLAFISALVGWSATAAVGAYCQRRPGTVGVAWLLAALGMALGLGAGFIGAMLEFGEATFRLFQIGVGLLAPLLLAWGAVEYAVESGRARFTTRLFVTTLAVVPLVVLSVDRVRGRFGATYPRAADHYDLIPLTLLLAVHVFAFAVLLAVAAVLLRSLRDRPGQARTQLAAVGLVTVAVLLSVVVGRFGAGLLGPVLMAGAVSALWGAAALAHSPRDRYDDYDDDDYYDDYYDEALDDEGGAEPRTRRDGADVPEKERAVRRKRRNADHYEDLYADPAPAPARQSRVKGVITIYTLNEGHARAFDELAHGLVTEVARREPDTLLFACHTVPSAPQQRIIYAIYRDELAYEEHGQQPHVMDFAQRRTGHIVATNVIDLALAGASAADNLANMLAPR